MKGEAASRVLRILLSSAITLLVCVSFVFESYASAQQSPSARIVGRWRSLERSKGGIGQIWEFRSDGTFDFSMGAVVDMPWRIENDQLILPSATIDGPEQKSTLKWFGDDKVRLETEWGATELVRVDYLSAPGNPIVGEWIGKSEMGGEARYLFYPNRQLLLLIPMTTQHGSYTISGSKLHLKGTKDTDFKFKLADNLLTLSAPKGGQESHYARY